MFRPHLHGKVWVTVGNPVPFAKCYNRKNFERHFQVGDVSPCTIPLTNHVFQEPRHAFGMRALGLPNTKHFHEITRIEDALACVYFPSLLSGQQLSGLLQWRKNSNKKVGAKSLSKKRPRN